MMYYHDGTAGMVWAMVLSSVFWIALIGFGVWAVMRITSRPATPQQVPPSRETPLEILERRYAAGEIDAEAFDEARARLRGEGMR
ncbi:MAG TPA: SHOCT domain-containing protein [Kribbellaceae bacterium]|jgi:putative membrane protein